MLRQAVRALPTSISDPLLFLWRVRVNYRADRSQRIASRLGLPHGTLAFDEKVQIRVPDNALAASVFRRMMFETGGHKEDVAFLYLAQGCTKLLDLGASGGFFSALFAKSRPVANILSVEMDPPSISVLRQTRERNLSEGVIWEIDERGVSDRAHTDTVVSSGYGSGLGENEQRSATAFAAINHQAPQRFEVQVETLPKICADHNFKPDIIKIDIESYEREALLGAGRWLRESLPKLALELHIDKLAQRGQSIEDLVSLLADIGYTLDGRDLTPDGCRARRDPDGSARLALEVKR